MKKVLRASYVGPFAVAYLVVLGLRGLINAIQYPLTEAAVRVVNFVLITTHSEVLPRGESAFGGLLLLVPLNSIDVAICLGCAALLARHLYPRTHAVVTPRTE